MTPEPLGPHLLIRRRNDYRCRRSGRVHDARNVFRAFPCGKAGANDAAPVAAATLAEIIRKNPTGQETILDIAREALPDGKEAVRLSIENRQLNPEAPPAPIRAASPRRAHTLFDGPGLVAYLAKYKTDNTVVLIDPITRQITAILDEKAPDGFEALTVKPQFHPSFIPWFELLTQRTVPVLKFAAFVLTHRRTISEPDGRELALTFSQIRSATKIEVQRGCGAKALNGIMVQSEIQGSSTDELVDLPEELTIETPILLSGDPAEITIDLTLAAGAPDAETVTKVNMTVTSPNLEETIVAEFEKIAAAVRGIAGVTVALGRDEYDPWDYIGRPATSFPHLPPA